MCFKYNKMKIIWWAPRCGKTFLSEKLSKKNNQEILSLDDFRMKIYKQLTKEEQKELFFLFYKIKNYSNLDKSVFNFFKNNQIIINILKKIWLKTNLEKFLKEFWEERYFNEEFKINKIITQIFLENFQKDIIIEWVSVCPEILNKFEIETENVIFLVKSDVNDILSILEKNPGSFKYRNFNNMAKLILKYGEKIEKSAIKNWYRVIDTSKSQDIKF